MNYESAQQAADRLGVTIHTIRRWARDGRIPGAVRQGQSWMIPVDFVPQAQITNDRQPIRTAMPLMNSAFPLGKCREFIERIPDEDDRAIAWGEYYYYSGQAELAAKTMEPYQDSADPVLRYSANLVGFFSNFTGGRTHLAVHAFEQLRADWQKGIRRESTPQLYAIGVFAVTASSVLLHLPLDDDINLQQSIRYLPEGLKLWACYVLAHKAYLEKNYSGSLAIAELALSMQPKLYPVGSIYVHLVAAMSLMSLKRVEEAKHHMAHAWELAEQDGFLQPFGEHHGLLQGMIERFFQKDYPETYEKIIAITYSFSAGWRKIHHLISKHEVADNLTTTEFTIAMLYNRGWTAKEIAAYMNLSPRTITNTIQVIYQKLGISSKRELGQFMLA